MFSLSRSTVGSSSGATFSKCRSCLKTGRTACLPENCVGFIHQESPGYIQTEFPGLPRRSKCINTKKNAESVLFSTYFQLVEL